MRLASLLSLGFGTKRRLPTLFSLDNAFSGILLSHDVLPINVRGRLMVRRAAESPVQKRRPTQLAQARYRRVL